MGKDALSQKTTKETPSNSKHVEASPIIFIIAIFAVIVIGLYFFKDKIFKKKPTNLSDLKSEQSEEPTEKAEPQVLEGEQKTEIDSKFADMN